MSDRAAAQHRLRTPDRAPSKDILRDLCDLLRENGEKVLNGDSKLSLTTNCLHMLNENFANISEEDFCTSFEVLPSNSPKLPQYHDLQFLYDFVQKTIALKLIHGSLTLRGAISLAAFKSLRTLELKKTPLHMIQGINKHRGKLTTLICTRCMKQLQDLLETCGGDMTSPMSWQNVHTACFSYNCFTKLDSSLRLLPVLEVLDLSHNSIQSTENYMEYLTEIQVVSMSYNQLRAVPSFSLSGAGKLQILLLRNNNLDSLQGLEELTGLRELDLANNCLSDHRELQPLRELLRLHKLDLEGNPIWYHSQHRIFTLENVHPLALGRPQEFWLMLDGRVVTEAEAVYCRKFHNLTSDSWVNISLAPETSRRLPHVSSASSFDLESSTNQTDDEPLSSRGSRKGKGTRRRSSLKKGSRRVRKPVISDISDADVDLMGDNSSETSYSSTPRDDSSHMDIKQTLETAREQLGPDWLQYLVHNKAAAFNQRRLDLARDAVVTNGARPDATEDDIFLNAEEELVRDSEEKDAKPTEEIHVLEEQSNGTSVVMETSHPDGDAQAQKDVTSSKQRHESHDSDNIINWKGSSTELQTDYGLESEPFIVFDPDDETQTQMLITVSERYIIEKDLNGTLVDVLDLKCLQTLTNTEEMVCSAAMEGTPVEMHVIRLTFDYVKKNRRERVYVMEDPNNAQEFENLVKPALEINQAETKRKETMHCLKCGRDFTKTEATLRRTRNSDAQPRRGSYIPGQEKDSPGEVVLCPFCGGGMIIQAEQQQVDAGGGSNFATPMGSFSLPGFGLGASPRTHSTPSKFDETSIASSSFKSIPDSSMASSTFQTMITNISQSSTIPAHTTTTLAPNSSEASFDVLDSSHTDSPFGVENVLYQASCTSVRPSEQDNASPSVFGGANQSPSVSGAANQKRKSESGSSVRKRQDSACSTGSDIIVLKRSSQTESEISLLSNPSQSSITVLEHESIYSRSTAEPVTFTIAGEPLPGSSHLTPGSSHLQPVLEGAADLSPSGSLTNKTLNSMVSSMYEKSLANDNICDSSDGTPSADPVAIVRSPSDESFQSVGSERDSSSARAHVTKPQDVATSSSSGDHLRLQANTSQDTSSIYSTTPTLSMGSNSSVDDTSRLYRYDNCAYVDHRLKLYLTMNVFSSDHEEFSLILKCGCVQYNKGEEFSCLLIVSSAKLYIYKITGEERGSHFDKWLRLVQTHPITSLHYVDIGMGYQSFHLEFIADNSSFTFLVRDERRCKLFLRPFTDVITSESLGSKSHLEGISKNNSKTLENLESQVLSVDDVDEDVDETMLKFSMGYLYTGNVDSKGKTSLSSVSVLVTPSHVFLVDESYHWPLPRSVSAAAKNKQQKQFQLQDRQRVNDITSMDLYQVAPREVSIHFLDEETNEECVWRVAMETDEALVSLVGAIRQPWETQFGVELQVNVIQAPGS